MIIIYILLLILLILFLQQKSVDSIHFLDKEQLFDLLKNDNDNYYKTFSKNDYKTRNINNINEYINLIKESTTDFTHLEKDKLIRCIEKVNIYFDNIKYEWFDGNKANAILWKIGCVKGKLYENGLPHTRIDTIILSKEHLNTYDNKLIKLLIHEKIHVYQKMYPNDVQLYIKLNGFIPIKKREMNDNIRANPDLDNLIYKDKESNIIRDVIYYPSDSQLYEHPYETMAITIENLYK
jgi:F0F1-type ATP synthase gamma subunit